MAQSETFLASRRRGLEEFLFLIVNHPVIQKDEFVVEFLSSENFSSIRNRASPAWQEEFASQPATQESESAPVHEPNWLIYDDAWRWSQQVKDAVEDLRKALALFSESNENSYRQLGVISERMIKILENTQHNDNADLAVPRTLEGLVPPHMRLAEDLNRDGLRVELFLRLITGCLVRTHHCHPLNL